jgi:hypothetical protein
MNTMTNQSYVYQSTPYASRDDGTVYTVGFYNPDGTWCAESDHDTVEGAEDQVSFLNGGATKGLQVAYKKVSAQNQELRKQNAALLDYAKNPGHYDEMQRRALVENMER